MKARFHNAVGPELAAAAEWYEQRRAGLGQALIEETRRALESIEKPPERWPPWPGIEHGPPIRRFVLPDFPFVLPYIVLREDVIILAVEHMRRHPQYWIERARTTRIR